ncbi:MAG: hypothetical protein HY200_09030 [Nitrospirae bacterium]|nr:hypothetical protein [Nitrospirota bacterium]
MQPYFEFPESFIKIIETLSLRESGHHRTEDFLKKVSPEIGRLSDLFNQKRGASPLSTTLTSGEYPLAYLSYFLPSNLFKLPAILLDFKRSHSNHPFFLEDSETALKNPFRILDLGAGPGTHGLGLLDFCGRHPEPFLRNRTVEYLAVDQDSRMLGYLKQLFSQYTRFLETVLAERAIRFIPRTIQEKVTTKFSESTGGFEMIILGNLLNEMIENGDSLSALSEWIRNLMTLLTPEGIIFVIEPALRKTSRNLLALRNLIVMQDSASIIAPCLHQHPCPIMEPQGSEKDWCHQEKEWGAPAWIQNIDQRIGLKKDALKYSYLILSRPGKAPHHSSQQWRMVSEIMTTKGKKEAFLCNESGRLRFYLLNREVRTSNQIFRDLKRGDLISIDRPDDLPGTRILPLWRVKKSD